MKRLESVSGRAFAIFTVSVLIACATVPLTGRRTFDLVPDSQVIALANDQYGEVLKKSQLSQDSAKVQMVQRVGQKIASATETFLKQNNQADEIKDFKWQFSLIQDDKTVNAWAMPGGKVAVYTGLLPVTQDENGLAVVLGHEIAHAIAKHGNERMSQGLIAQLGGVGLSVALAQQPVATQQLFQTAYGVGANVGFLLPYSRVQENEADRIGLVLMALAGYDPRNAVPLWQRMAAQGGARTPEFLSTHPNPQSRIENIKSLIPEAMKYYRPQ